MLITKKKRDLTQLFKQQQNYAKYSPVLNPLRKC